MELRDLLQELEEEDKKKNFRNFLGNKFPKGWFGYHPMHIITHPWKILEEFGLQTKWAWQRVFRGWDDRVIWSIDFYLSDKIPQWMERLKKTKNGIPMMMFKREDDWTNDETSEKREKEYDLILDKIIFGFREYHRMHEDILSEEEETKAKKEFNEAFDLFREYFETFWD